MYNVQFTNVQLMFVADLRLFGCDSVDDGVLIINTFGGNDVEWHGTQYKH